MIKNAANILLIVLLLSGTAGLTINRHYCGRNLVQTSLFSTPDNCCGKDCPFCHNEKLTLRITDQFESKQAQTDFNAGFHTLLNQISLPTLLAFSNQHDGSLSNYLIGDHFVKPWLAKPISADRSSPVLQVFLF